MNSFTNLERNTGNKSIYDRTNYRTDRIRAILKALGNPQESYKTIHIAGSKGKGSTASYIASAITTAGYKTGLYMSPHVTDFRERFTIDGKFIEYNVLVDTFNELYTCIGNEFLNTENPQKKPTTFELYTIFAFFLFKKQQCRWAVIETGLGGRLDATNVLFPVCSIITPIELEHTEILGDTIEKIAVEKSKIIKNNTDVFISFQKPEAEKVLIEEAVRCNSRLYSLKENIATINTSIVDGKQDTEIIYCDGSVFRLKLKMIGEVQSYNCALALSVIIDLGLYTKGITESALEQNTLPGRMEKLNFPIPLYIDGAHTPNSMEGCLKTFRSIFPDKKGACIFGCVSDKKYKELCDMILKSFDNVIICKPGTFKESKIEEIYNYALSKAGDCQNITMALDSNDALSTCINKKYECVLSCGSFYLAGIVKEAASCLTGKSLS